MSRDIDERCWWCDEDLEGQVLTEHIKKHPVTKFEAEVSSMVSVADFCDHFCCDLPANVCRVRTLAREIERLLADERTHGRQEANGDWLSCLIGRAGDTSYGELAGPILNVSDTLTRFIEAERKPMECGHPRACLVPGHFFRAMKPCNKPYDVYVCEICGQQMHSHTDGGGTAWIMKEYCSTCAERERVREMCCQAFCSYCKEDNKNLFTGVDGFLMHRIKYEGTDVSDVCAAAPIRQLDLTKDLAPSTGKPNG